MKKAILNYPVLDKGYIKLLDYINSYKSIESLSNLITETYGKQRLIAIFGGDEGAFSKLTKEDMITFASTYALTAPFKNIIFRVKMKMPLFIAIQWFRKTSNYTKIRLQQNHEDLEFYLPLLYEGSEDISKSEQAVLNTDLELHYIKALNLYNKLIEDGITHRQAEMVLPQSLYVEFYDTITLEDFIGWYRKLGILKELYCHELMCYVAALDRIVEETLPLKIMKQLKKGISN